jgi:predicted esterase
MRRLFPAVLAVVLLAAAPPGASAVTPVVDASSGAFFDVPFPHELRRDADGTVSIAGFPFPANPLVEQYRGAIETTAGFGIASGVFFRFDGAIDPASLPADPEASRQPGASVFLIDVDPHSRTRGTRIPLWTDFRAAADAYRPGNLLALMPVPGHVLEHGTLYAAVVTDALLDATAAPVAVAPAIARLAAGTPADAFEAAALPLYQTLWRHLEEREGLSRAAVVAATVFRTGTPARTIELAGRVLRRRPRPDTSALAESATTARCRLVRGDLLLPQFQNGTPPFTVAGTGAFVLDANGAPVEQREEPVGVTLCVPQEPADGSLPMPRRGWPIVLYMHGTGGSRQSFVNEGVADDLAALGIASMSFDQPMHGPRPGVADDFYNPLNPLSFRDNSRQSAVEGLLLDDLMGRLRFEPSAFTLPPSAGFVAPTRRVGFDRRRRGFFGHSQGSTVGPLLLPFSKGTRGGVLSAGGGHLLLNILTRDTPLLAGQTAKQLTELLLGAPMDVFHPALHLIQMGGEVSDPLGYVDRFAVHRRGRALNVLFTHGMLDPDVPTTLTASMVVAARYPLVAPTYPNRVFPALPGYDYQEAFALAGLPTSTPPLTGNLRRATGGLVLYELDGHFPAFDNPDARAQWKGFLDSLVHDRMATIPARP